MSTGTSLWGGRFSDGPSDALFALSRSVQFDWRLAPYDLRSSLAHLAVLESSELLPADTANKLRSALKELQSEVTSGKFLPIDSDEDAHSALERGLTEKIGAVGGAIRAGRSRNDQVATDLRLWLRGSVDEIAVTLKALRTALLDLAEKHAATIMPGHTHLQVAQPTTFGHHLMAYYEMFSRDASRLADLRTRFNRLPLGAAALAGTTYPIDREQVAKILGFDGICNNSLDAVSDRDFAIEFCAFASILMMHVSRLSEELVLWLSPRFGFIDLPDRFCTGSSIMPQKKNPDVPELARGKTGRVYGDLMSLLTLMKSQPLAYNKDNQEDKEPLFDAVDTVQDTLRIFADMVPHIEVKADIMKAAAEEGFATATDLADYLVKKGLAFRDAHEAVAHAVKACVGRNCMLTDLSLSELRFACGLDNRPELISDDVFALLTVDGSVQSRQHAGGTAPSQVLAAIKRGRTDL